MTERKQYLYRIQPARADMLSLGATLEEANIIDQHEQYLGRLLAEGRLIHAGRTLNEDASSFGIVIFEAPDDQAANEIMLNDPAVIKGVFNAWLFPYNTTYRRG